MKHNTYLILAVLSLSAIACQKEFQNPIEAEQSDTLCGYTFQADETKIFMGKEVHGAFPLLWSKGDELAIRNSVGTIRAMAILSNGESRSFGKFKVSQNSAPGASEALRIVYPATAVSKFSSNTLPSEQTQKGGSDVRCFLSDYAFACTDFTYNSTFNVTFTLKHVYSYLCLRLSAEETGYSGLNIKDVTFQCGGSKLSGTFSTDYATLAVTPASSEDYVKVVYDGAISLSQGEVDVWLAVLPCDLRGKTVNVTINGTYKNQPVSIPMTFSGINLEQGKANLLDCSGFDHSKPIVDWYEPVDSRTMVGEGYCYGPANTFIIQCKNGSTYTGGSYQPDGEYPSSVTFDFRARGDKSKCIDPKDCTFGWATKKYDITTDASEAYVTRTQLFTASNIAPIGYSFTVDKENYTVTVTNKTAHAGSPILIMKDASGNIVWGWAFWNIAADGTKLEKVKQISPSNPEDIVYLANMDIGQPTTNYNLFAQANDGARNKAKEQIARFVHKYQWGRYLPTFWETHGSLGYAGSSTDGNIPAVKGPLTLKESLKYPYGLVAAAAGSNLTDWNSNPDGNLWGNMGNSRLNYGHKTNYDPCPKGWKVPDQYTMSKWKEYANSSNGGSITLITAAGAKGVVTGRTETAYFHASGQYTNAVTASGWIGTNGIQEDGNVSSMTGGWWGSFTYQNVCTPNAYILNATSTTSNPDSIEPGNGKSSEDYYHSEVSSAYRARAFSVRCMPDTENR